MRGTWDRRRAAAIAIGGGAGAGLRWLALTTTDPGRFPWPVLALNVAGSVLLGVLLAEEWSHPKLRLLLHDAGGIGFCGGLTTFSTFAVEVVDLARDGSPGLAGLYVIVSVSTALAGVAAGAGLLHGLKAVMMPLEEEW